LDDFTNFIGDVERIQAPTGLGLEFFKENHGTILSQAADIGVGRAFEVPEHAFR
jgi:hypothetical protein